MNSVVTIAFGLLVGVVALVGILAFYILGNAIESKVRGLFQKKASPEEREQMRLAYNEELMNPQFDEVERLLGGKLPNSIVELYSNRVLLAEEEFEVVASDGYDAHETSYIVGFTPCTVKHQRDNFLPKDEGHFFEFANDGCGQSYYVQLSTERQDDTPVYYWDHETSEPFDMVAPSVRAFLSWDRRPLSSG